MVDVMLINPANTWEHHSSMPPLGIASVASVLEQTGLQVSILDQEVDQRPLEHLLLAEKPRVVGIGGTTHTRFRAFELAVAVKKTLPGTAVLYGGPHATFTAEDCLLNVPAIDAVVHGEGEYTTRDVVRAVIDGVSDLSGIPGISCRCGDHVVRSPPRDPIHDLDELPFPARHLLPMHRYRTTLEFREQLLATHVMTARGCPVNCTFCSASAMWGRRYRTRSPERAADEVEALIRDYGIAGLKIFDSTLTLRRDVFGSLGQL